MNSKSGQIVHGIRTENHQSCGTERHFEHRVVGPPGCGKTTWIERQIVRAVEAFGIDPNQCTEILVTTLTRAAAGEIRRRSVGLPRDQIGTLHSHAWRVLGRPDLIYSKEAVKDWNERCDPRNQVSAFGNIEVDDEENDGQGTIDGQSGKLPGDKQLALYHLGRALLVPELRVFRSLSASFVDEYEAWKHSSGLLDFSDVIDQAFCQSEAAPGLPRLIFVDEAQDHNASQFRLLRKWGNRCERLIVVGDPWQNLYEWCGSKPDAFYGVDLPEENKIILKQSYRVPRAVHSEAVRMIHRISHEEDFEYLPRDHEGEVIEMGWSIQKNAEHIVADIELSRYGKTIMILSQGGYMLSSIIAQLRAEGIPFCNQYRLKNGRWNPIRLYTKGSTCSRLATYLYPNTDYYDEPHVWTMGELSYWIALISGTGVLSHGAKKEITTKAKAAADKPVDFEWLESLFVSRKEYEEMAECNPWWLASNALSDKRRSLDYLCRVVSKYGIDGISTQPLICVGTIHSVKGGEADVVYLCPDLSKAAYEQYTFDESAVTRLMYVGMTRARETLVLLRPENRYMSVIW